MYLSLVLESVFSDQFQLLVETGLLERSPWSGECLPVVLRNFPVDHLVLSNKHSSESYKLTITIDRRTKYDLINRAGMDCSVFISHVATQACDAAADLGNILEAFQVGESRELRPANESLGLTEINRHSSGDTAGQCRLQHFTFE